ncbi:carboxypeptidase D [Lepeophtheirus salmonis]|uniref:carboxypeptidase D n=1 Tax=Lepeophtheirus salmonis TaxID=72036 RepID=UPI001AE78B6D|nr:carboxypeptidase D-like isoform X1 [Lepeophtheirus salmonis]
MVIILIYAFPFNTQKISVMFFSRCFLLIMVAHDIVSQSNQLSQQCLTKSSGDLPCIFPFIYKDEINFSCTRNYKMDGRLEGWCPTKVNRKNLEGSNWYECRSDSMCPLLHYHDHEHLIKSLVDLEKEYPSLSNTFQIGRSVRGQKILGIRISEGLHIGSRKKLKPMVKLLANMHGNEPVGRELLLYFASYILGSYGIDDRLTKFINTTDLWIVPTINPDGFARASEGACEGGGYKEGRFNEGRKDLNRDFPTWMDIEKINLEEGRQTETKSLIQFILNYPFVLSANFHDGAVLVNYPWDDYHNNDTQTWVGLNKAPDHDVFYHLATTYSFNHPTMSKGNACTKWGLMKDGVTNGADWYPVIGGMQDFNYLFSNALEMTMELSCCKFPSRKVLIKEWDKNKESIISYIEQVHIGIKGLVLDRNDNPIGGATIKIRDPLSGKPSGKDVKSSKYGEYWKLLIPGKMYQVMGIKMTPEGSIYSSNWKDIFVSEGSAIEINIKLFK